MIALLAKAFGRPRRDVSLVAGEKSRDKRVAIEGLSDADFKARLSEILEQAASP
jgi:uncharacterized protein YggU (UPF0235/DUF167 family)